MQDEPSPLWQVLNERDLFVHPRVRVTAQRIGLPDGRVVDDYIRVYLGDFVVMLAEAEDGRFIMERQYKHGPGRVVLTLPAGSIEVDETPEAAAPRELLEETGYQAAEWQSLGRYPTLGNAGGQMGHLFIATGCRRVAEPDSGDLEEMTIELMTAEQLLLAVRANEIATGMDLGCLLYGLIALGHLSI